MNLSVSGSFSLGGVKAHAVPCTDTLWMLWRHARCNAQTHSECYEGTHSAMHRHALSGVKTHLVQCTDIMGSKERLYWGHIINMGQRHSGIITCGILNLFSMAHSLRSQGLQQLLKLQLPGPWVLSHTCIFKMAHGLPEGIDQIYGSEFLFCCCPRHISSCCNQAPSRSSFQKGGTFVDSQFWGTVHPAEEVMGAETWAVC